MQAGQTIGIDLPLKALVWQDAAGQTWLSYNEPAWFAQRHSLGSGTDKIIANMSQALKTIISKAAASPRPRRFYPLSETQRTSLSHNQPATNYVNPDLSRLSGHRTRKT